MIDLHIHTSASSDGQHSAPELFEMARRKGLRAIAFADHNSVGSVAEGFRLSAEFGMEFISCLELNTYFNDLDLHLLAYDVDPMSPALNRWLENISRWKQEQAEERVRKLNQLGFVFSREDLQKFSGDRNATGVSFLQAILSREENRRDPRLRPYLSGSKSQSPYVNFYRDYLRGGKPASVIIEDLSTPGVIQKVKELGGIPILAHPSDTGEENILSLIENGLEGLEVYSPYHNTQEEKNFRALAERFGLLITAGSDFHGKSVKPDVEIGVVSGNSYDLFLKLKERRRRNLR